jgi:D-aminopeptidase
VTIEFFKSDMADRATRIPFTKREGTRVSLTAPEMGSAYNGFSAMVMLASG